MSWENDWGAVKEVSRTFHLIDSIYGFNPDSNLMLHRLKSSKDRSEAVQERALQLASRRQQSKAAKEAPLRRLFL